MAPETILYTELKARLKTNIKELKTIRLFNNQFERTNGEGYDGRKDNLPEYPCVFIQIIPDEMADGSAGWQSVNYIIRLHLGVWSEADEDVTFLELKNSIYKNVHRWQPSSNWNQLIRMSEEPNWDHDNVNIYQMDFKVNLADFDAQNIGTYRKVNLSLNQNVSLTQSQTNI